MPTIFDRLRSLRFLLGLVLICVAQVAGADVPTKEIGPNMPMDPLTSFSIFRDKTGRLPNERILSGQYESNFIDSSPSKHALGVTADAWWMRFSVTNPSETDRSFVVHYPFPMVDMVDFYLVSEGKVLSSLESGEKRAPAIGDLRAEGYAVKFTLEGHQSAMVYMRLQNTRGDILDSYFEVGSPTHFVIHQNRINLFLGFVLGGGIIVLVYNFVLWCVVRQSIYGWYVAYLSLALMTFSVVSGVWHHFFEVHEGILSEALPPLLSSLTFVLLVQFSRQFLQTKELIPRIDRIMRGSMVVFMVPVALFFAGYSGMAAKTALLITVALNALPVLGLYLWRKGNPVARIYAAAWAIWVFSICGISGRALGWFPSNDYTIRIGWLGIWGEAILFALALAARIRVLNQQKLAAEANAREILERSNSELERLVSERTQDLENKRNQLEVLNEEKDQFFSIIAHDLRNPFHGFSSMMQLLAEEWRDLPDDEIQSILEEMNQGATQLHRLLENLLTWAQLQRGSMVLEPEELRLEPLLRNCVELFQNSTDQKGIRLEWEVDAGLRVHANARGLETVVRNLIGNAIKYSHSGDQVTVRATRKDDAVLIAVEDTGVGIPEEKLGNLLKLGERNSTLGTDGEKGSGLGLQLCKELIDNLGGELIVESQEGVGSRFVVRFSTVASAR
tara:strand:- start:8133 stop:10157 length:2025 start_codon:yes stop_codon:yes gene_type:complete